MFDIYLSKILLAQTQQTQKLLIRLISEIIHNILIKKHWLYRRICYYITENNTKCISFSFKWFSLYFQLHSQKCRWNVNQKSQDTRKHWQSSFQETHFLLYFYLLICCWLSILLAHFSHSDAHRLHKRPIFYNKKNLIEFLCSSRALFKYMISTGKRAPKRKKSRIGRKENIGLQMFSFILFLTSPRFIFNFQLFSLFGHSTWRFLNWINVYCST